MNTRTRHGFAGAVLFAACYAAAVLRLQAGGRSLEEALAILVLMGLAFPALAALLLRRSASLPPPAPPAGGPVLAATFGLLAFVTLYLAAGADAVDAALPAAWHASAAAHDVVVLAKKLLVFVLVPYAVLHAAFGRRPRDFGLGAPALRALRGRHGVAALVLSLALCAFQLLAGRGAAPIRDGEIAGATLAAGLALTFAWNLLEAGVVEEFFFRAVLQERLAAALRSDVAAVFVGALLFGLAHAPGYVLRAGGVADALGSHPGASDAIAYSIAVPAVASFLFAYLWLRTRNLYVGIVVHAAVDTLPNTADFVRAWGLG